MCLYRMGVVVKCALRAARQTEVLNASVRSKIPHLQRCKIYRSESKHCHTSILLLLLFYYYMYMYMY